MEASKTINNSEKRSRRARRVFLDYIGLYIVLFVVAMLYSRYRFKGEVWFYFAWVIGAIYVFCAFSYFYEKYLLPYIEDLQKPIPPSTRNVHFWICEWLLPAVAVQLFVFIGFWMTVHVLPLKENIYANPYMYGQIYKKLENYLSPDLEAAGLVKKLGEVKSEANRIKLEDRARFLEDEFSGHLKEFAPKKEKKGEEYINSITHMVSVFYKIPFYIALSFAFLGTLMYALNNMVYRFFISDLYPKTYVSYLIRFLFVPALSMVIAYFLMNDWWINGAPIIFFLIGFFPQMALQYIEEKARTFLKLKKEEKQVIPLGLMQGMTDYIIYRFMELGINDAQNLAYSDLNYLRKNWYNDRQLCDFVAQAVLLIHLKKHFSTLQNAGIRNIVSFKNIIVDPTTCAEYAKKLGIPQKKLDVVMKLVGRSPLSDRIDIIQTIIDQFDRKEINHIIFSGITVSKKTNQAE